MKILSIPKNMSNDILMPVLLLTILGTYLVYSVFFSTHGILRKQSVELCKSKYYFEAISTLEQLLKILPYYSPAWFYRGLLLSATEQFTEAVKSYNTAIKYGANYNYNFRSKVWYNKGLALYEIKNYHDSIANYDL
ncbi:MAG: hypothetical protein HC775_18930, partial [Hyellaceae cyanobacterium CSU_1_1]|nr:hypothetical protein [Hyellaceae cyanobacterium CSU_1_1]